MPPILGGRWPTGLAQLGLDDLAVAGDARGAAAIGRYAGLVVFSIRVKQPQSVAGRIWNLGQETLATFSLTVIALELAGVIARSWWWVLSPLWISGIVVAAVLCGVPHPATVAWADGQHHSHRVNRRHDLDD
jgi:hypothetical protein